MRYSTTTERVVWMRAMADTLARGKLDPADVTEDWQRDALGYACPDDGCELCEASPAKLDELADELEARAEDATHA